MIYGAERLNAEGARFLATKGTPVVLLCSNRTAVLAEYFQERTLWINGFAEKELITFLRTKYPEVEYERAREIAKETKDMRQAQNHANILDKRSRWAFACLQ